jgi:hypothetical protein
MTKKTLRTVSRRTVLAAGTLVGLGGVSVPVLAAPPKGVEPADPDAEVEAVVRKIDGMLGTIDRIQTRLQSCGDDDVCGTVLEHSFVRKNLTNTAKRQSQDREWGPARVSLTEVKGIVEGDIELLEGVEDRGSIGDVLGLERALLNQTVSTLSVMPGDNAT